jgi:lysophospholipid acyltransferase (LPLAT)-like uncharacterized protein
MDICFTIMDHLFYDFRFSIHDSRVREGTPLKIRNPFVLKTASRLCSSLVYSLGRTIRVRYRFIGENSLPGAANPGRRYIYLFWHEYMLLPSFRYAMPDIHVLVSKHTDGVFIGDVMKRLGFSMAYGSSTRGGSEAIRNMLKLSKTSHFAITPDGPRGPRRQAKMGAIFLAAQTGLPIVAAGCGFSSAWRAKSWDRFAFPHPFSKGCIVSAPPLFVPKKATSDELERYRREVEAKLLAVTAIAERWAATGQYDTYEYDSLGTHSWS